MSTSITRSPDTPALGAPAQGVLMQQILNTVERVAVSDLSVRIVGENGTGKEWLARIIHAMSARADRGFVALDCSRISLDHVRREIFGSETAGETGREIRPGILESANGGTVYFDRISALPIGIRKEVVGAFERQHFRRIGGVEDVHFNVRAIEGVSVPLDESDLRTGSGTLTFIRLGQVGINLPPLRERRDGIPYLVAEFIREWNGRGQAFLEGIAPDALELCSAYDWPGNIRELRKVLESAALLARTGCIERNHVSPFLKLRPAGVTREFSQLQFGI